MPINVNVNGSWIDIKTPFVYHNGSWRTIIKQGVNDNGSWRSVLGDSGRIFAWGEFVGDGTTNYYSTPVYLTGSGTDWKKISSSISPEHGLQLANNSTSEVYSNVPTRVTAGIKVDGTLWVWGKDEIGRFGTGEQIYITPSSDNSNVYYGYSYGRLANQFGNTPYPGLQTEYLTPVPTIYGENSWKDVSVGRHACAAIKTDGTLWVWGSNLHYQLSVTDSPRNTNISTAFSTPKSIHSSYGTDWKQVSVGDMMTAAIDAQGRLFWWGGQHVDRYEGKLSEPGGIEEEQVKIPTITSSNSGFPTIVFGTSDWAKVSCGRNHTGAVKTDGTLWMWGINTYGQCGSTDADWSNLTTYQSFRISNWCVGSPTTPNGGGTDWEDVHCGNEFTIAKKKNGTLWTWGKINDDRLGRADGNLGLAYPDNSSTPVPVVLNAFQPMKLYGHPTGWKSSSTTNPDDFDTFTIGGINQFTSEIKGMGEGAAPGAGSLIYSQVDLDRRLYYMKTKNSCMAIKTDGTLWAWGSNITSQLGIDVNYNVFSGDSSSSMYRPVIGAQDMDVHTPVPVFGGATNWKSIHTGTGFSCGLKTDGTMWMWGYQHLAKVLPPSQSFISNDAKKSIYYDFYESQVTTHSQFSTTPRLVPGNNWKQVCIGPYISAAIRTDGTLWWFGKTYGADTWTWPGNYQQDGEPHTTIGSPTPIPSYFNNNWSTRASLDDGTDSTIVIHGWRANTSSSTSSDDPNNIGGGMAIKTDGTLWWWGNLKSPVLWSGEYIYNKALITPTNFRTGWKCIYGDYWDIAGSEFNYSQYMGIKTNGTMWCWGGRNSGLVRSYTGSLGAFPIPPTPVEVGGTTWKSGAVSAPKAGGLNYAVSYGIKTDGTLWGWGILALLGTGVFTESTGASYSYDYGNNWYGTPLQIAGNNWKKVVVGNDYSYYTRTIGLKTDGTVWTWGFQQSDSSYYQGWSKNFYSPVQCSLPACKDISMSKDGRVSFAIGTNGNLYQWGHTAEHQGLRSGYAGVYTYSNPSQISGSWKYVHAGIYANYGIKTDGTLWSWGRFSWSKRNEESSNGNWNILPYNGVKWSKPLWDYAFSPWTPQPFPPADYVNYPVNLSIPALVDSGTDWAEVYTSLGSHPQNYALKTNGTMWVWGIAAQDIYPFKDNGPLQFNLTTDQKPPIYWKKELAWTPVCVGLGREPVWKQISLGAYAAAAIKTDGSLWTTVTYDGFSGTYPGNKSALGRGSLDDFPRTLTSELYSSNTIMRWGTVAGGGNNWKQVACAWYNTVAIKTDGTMWHWGHASSQFTGDFDGEINDAAAPGTGIPFTTPQSGGLTKLWYESYYTPHPISGTNWKQVSAGAFHFGAVKTDGTLWMWGQNTYGQCGRSDTSRIYSPVTPEGGYNDWLQVKCSETMTMAIRGDGTNNYIYVWGGSGSIPNFSRGYLRARYSNTETTPFTYDSDTSTALGYKLKSAIPYMNSALAQNAVYNLIGEIPGSWDRIIGTNSKIHDIETATTESGGMATKIDGTLWVWGKSVGTLVSSYTPTGIVSQNNYSWTVIGNNYAIQRAIG